MQQGTTGADQLRLRSFSDMQAHLTMSSFVELRGYTPQVRRSKVGGREKKQNLIL
jgi:hypothetical protein